MIEFKSDCGHTVRARDEDAGKKVRCSYCGQSAEVPTTGEDEVDFLFSELDLPVGGGKAKAAWPVSRGLVSRRRRGNFNPMSLVLRLIYAGALICVIVIVTKKGILPYFAALSNSNAATRGNEAADAAQGHNPGHTNRRSQRHQGLIALADRGGGLYIASFPDDATAYCVDSSVQNREVRVSDEKDCRRALIGEPLPMPQGTFTVEVVLPWNAPSLTRYPGYNTQFRRKLENAPGSAQRNRIVLDYFLPDGADNVFVSESDGQIFIVHQFHGVRTRSDRWTSVRALFIPADLDVERMTTDYVIPAQNYAFDEGYVRSELEYYDVPAADRVFVLDVLKRLGVLPYVTQDPQTQVRRMRLFKIGIEDGMFAAPVLRQAGV